MLNTIFRKLNTFKRISFLDKNIKNYVALNKEIFNQKFDTKKKIDGIILIDFFDWNPFIFFWSILSNFLKKKNNLEIKFFYFPLYNTFTEKHFFFKRRLLKIYNSFGCSIGITSLKKKPSNEQNKIYSSFLKNIKNKNDLINYTYNSVLIGDLIYDTVLRRYSIPTFNIIDEKFKKTFIEAHFICDLIFDYFENNEVKYVVVSDIVYNSFGLITRIANFKNINVLHLSENGFSNFRLMFFNSEIRTTRNPYNRYKKIFSNLSENQKEIALKKGATLLKNRVNGDIFTGIEYADKSPFNINSNNSNNLFNKNSFQVLLALHNFFDNPHKYRFLYYDDYLDWALNTIDILSKKQFNTYVKWHPISFKNPSDKKAKIVINQRLKSFSNVKMVVDEISYNDMIQNGLKWAITAHGTIANELPYFGVKVLNCGDNPHINYKFSITPTSKEDYEFNLNNLKNINYEIDKNEMYEFYYMNYIHFKQKNYTNKINDNDYVYQKNKRLDAELNNSSEYYRFATNQIKKNNIIDKTEKYIDEFLYKNLK